MVVGADTAEKMLPAWTPLDKPRRLEEDRGNYFRYPNAARFLSYPLEPAVRTLLTEQEDLEI